MVEEVLAGLSIQAGKQYIDATLGGGGHAMEIVKRGGILLGIDADADAIEYARDRLKSDSCTLVQGNFRNIETIAKENGFEEVSGIVMDLGVSSYQLDTADKGFSYRFLEAPLDSRFDRTKGESAAECVNHSSEEELYEVFTKFGEEERAGPIAHALIRARSVKEITTVGDIVRVVKLVAGDNKQTTGVLSRIFQALRMQVNDEVIALREGLAGAERILAPGGMFAVISFHSLEDRVVKLFMQGDGWHQITKKPTIATLSEWRANSRSRSAKLRIAQKI